MQIQKIHSIYIYHLFRSKDSKDSLLYCSSILLYSDTELSLIKSKKKNYFFFCFLNSHIHYPEDSFISGLFKISQTVALLRGALLISLPQRADASPTESTFRIIMLSQK